MQIIPDPNNHSRAAPTNPTDELQADASPTELTPATLSAVTSSRRTARLLLILEGGHDTSFLKNISGILHADDTQITAWTMFMCPCGSVGGSSETLTFSFPSSASSSPSFM